MTARPFEDYLREFRIRGSIASHPEGAPVLVRYGGKETNGDPDKAFRTAFVRSEQSQASSIDLPASQEVQLGTVIVIVKPQGAPFPEQIGIGRAANTDVCLALNTISKYHAFF